MISRIEEALRNALTLSRPVPDDRDIPIVIQYRAINDNAANRFAMIRVSSVGDIVFYRGSTAATVTLDTNISGGATGYIDVSNAAYNTFGEVADYINSLTATAGYRAMLLDCLRSDSSNDSLGTLARTNAGVQSTGISLLADTDNAARLQIAVNLRKFRTFQSGRSGVPAETNWQPVLRRVTSLINYVTGAAQLRVYSRVGTVETEVLRFAGGADNTEAVKEFAGNDPLAGFFGPSGGELIVVGRAASTMAVWSNGYVNVEYKNVSTAR